MSPEQATQIFAHRLEDRASDFVHAPDAEVVQTADRLFSAYAYIMDTHPGIATALQKQIDQDRAANPLLPEIHVGESEFMVTGSRSDTQAHHSMVRSRDP